MKESLFFFNADDNIFEENEKEENGNEDNEPMLAGSLDSSTKRKFLLGSNSTGDLKIESREKILKKRKKHKRFSPPVKRIKTLTPSKELYKSFTEDLTNKISITDVFTDIPSEDDTM